MAEGAAGDAGASAGAVARDLVRPGDVAATPARVGLQRRGPAGAAWTDGREGRGTAWLDGYGYAAGLLVRPATIVVQLLQATLRSGDESADRSHPRRDGDVADQLYRDGAQHSA